MKRVAIVTLAWREYTTKYLADFISAVKEQDYQGEIKVIITDNETSPETAAFIQKIAPDSDLILNQKNDGYAKGMNDGIKEAIRQNFDYIAVVNIHNFIEPQYIRELVKAAERDEKFGVVQGLMLLPDRGTVMSRGVATHFLGFGYALGYKDPYVSDKTQFAGYPEIFYPSGASMFFRRDVLQKIGLMDEEFWMYNEDQEIGWRLWLAGYKCVLAPKAITVSDYDFSRSIKKVYWMDRNRILSILLCYKLLTLLLIAPAFFAMEIGQAYFAWRNGWLTKKFQVWYYFLNPRTWYYIKEARKRNQDLRIIEDREIAKMISSQILHQEFDDWKMKTANRFFNLYWNIVKKMIFW